MAKQLKKEKGAVAGYTDEENPFGDTQLSDKFVWNKKLEKQIQEGTDVREFSAAAERLRQEERVVRCLGGGGGRGGRRGRWPGAAKGGGTLSGRDMRVCWGAAGGDREGQEAAA